MSLDHARLYLCRVVPWMEGAFVNLHWTTSEINPKTGKPYWSGRACSSVEEAVRTLAWAQGLSNTRDIYLCLSAQSAFEEKVSRSGNSYKRAIKTQQNAVALRSLFLDLDVKDGGYATTQDALAALKQFVADTGLPVPTLAVASGTGGVHVYWCMSRDVPLNEWQPLANALAEATRRHGLLCDTQCTVDGARVLRVPGTRNHKPGGGAVTLGVKSVQPGDYPVDVLAGALGPYMGARVIPLRPTGQAPQAGLPAAFAAALGAPNARLAAMAGGEFADGIQTGSAPVVIEDMAEVCGFVHDALATGGADLNNPLWNLATLVATFSVGSDGTDGRALAHKMAAGHPDYDPATTDDLYDRKVREREEKDMGWPKCQSIQNAGCGNCATCPMLQADKSPLAHGRAVSGIKAQAATVPGNQGGAAVPPAGVALTDELPPGYGRNAVGVIHRLVAQEDGGYEQRDVVPYVMSAAWLQDGPWTLHFTTRLGNSQKDTQVSISLEKLPGREFTTQLGRQGMVVNKHQAPLLQEFLVSWTTLLQSKKDAVVSSSPFGWSSVNGKIEGFIYGGRVWAGPVDKPAAAPDPVVELLYKPHGELQPWIDAAQYITAQRRPALDAIIATSFGAPLMRFTGEPGVIVSAYSSESGIGKSTTLKIAQSVWGQPVRAMQTLSDTQNSVLKKLGELKSLPLYWDELKTDVDTQRFVSLAFQISQGKEKSRLGADTAQRSPGSWNTILTAASNDSLVDVVARQTKTTTAGVYRVFEFVVPPALSNADVHGLVARLVAKTEDHYGQAGLVYAKFLGEHHAQIAKDVATLQDKLTTKVGAKPDERFWIAGMTTMILGAKYANELGLTKIDVPGLMAFLAGTLTKLRSTRNDGSVDMNNPDALLGVVQSFIAKHSARHLLVTERVHKGQGRPAANSVKIIGDATKMDGIYIQIGIQDKCMRFSASHFRDWLMAQGYSPFIIQSALENQFGAKRLGGFLGSGTGMAGFKENLIELDLSGTKLSSMEQFTP